MSTQPNQMVCNDAQYRISWRDPRVRRPISLRFNPSRRPAPTPTSRQGANRLWRPDIFRLATKASRGGGPPYQLFGKIAIYTWGTLVAWALAEMGEPARSASEHRARQGTPAPQSPSQEKLASMVEGSRRYNAARVAARKASATLRSEEPRGPPGEAAASKTE